MRLVTASAKNHSRIRPSDSVSAITTARAERLGRLLAGNNIDCEPDRFRSACKIHCQDRVGLQSFSLGRTFLGNHYGAALTEHVIGKPASKQGVTTEGWAHYAEQIMEQGLRGG